MPTISSTSKELHTMVLWTWETRPFSAGEWSISSSYGSISRVTGGKASASRWKGSTNRRNTWKSTFWREKAGTSWWWRRQTPLVFATGTFPRRWRKRTSRAKTSSILWWARWQCRQRSTWWRRARCCWAIPSPSCPITFGGRLCPIPFRPTNNCNRISRWFRSTARRHTWNSLPETSLWYLKYYSK